MYYWLFSGGTAACRDRDCRGRIYDNRHFNGFVNAALINVHIVLSFPWCLAAGRAEVKFKVTVCKCIGFQGSICGHKEVRCERHRLHGLNAGPLHSHRLATPIPFSMELLCITAKIRLYHHPIGVRPISIRLNVLPFGIVVEPSSFLMLGC